MRRQRERGAALLLAMMIVALIVTTAAGMVWMQTRAVHVEAAERARSQGGWMLSGALDWARLILREDQRSSQRGGVDSLDEPWAQKLAEARLSSFLAADQDNNADADLEVFLSGGIADAQARYNLRNLVDVEGKVVPAQVLALQRLADLAGAPADTATRIADGLAQASAPGVATSAEGAPLKPARVADLAWLGIEPALIERLAPWVELLPVTTAVNVNTAPREVLVAAIDGLDLGSAERLVQARARKPFENLDQVQAQLPPTLKAEAGHVSVNTSWFEVTGRLRLEDRVLEERSLLQRDTNQVSIRRRERLSFTTAPSR
jgi:general secretion pathway protein K